ncbi:MAG: polysaccharide deacetylase family protein [Hadesarchaea archaeon]|nr:polysaccharide deacetylase family protein [Hadesarchaea archaeon]
MKWAGLVLTAMLVTTAIGVLETAEPVSANPGSIVWNFECHTHSHPDLTTLTDNQIRAEMDAVDNAFTAHGLLTPKHHAYPGGAHDDRVEAILAEYRLSGRMVWGTQNTYPINDWFKLKAAQLKKTTPLSKIQGWMDDCITDNALLVILTHDVKASPTVYGCTPELLHQSLDYAIEKQNAGLLEVVTIADAYDYWSTASEGKAMVVFTFDDAWNTDYDNVYPIFNDHGVAGTSYIITGAIENDAWDDTANRLTWAMIEEMSADNTPPVISNVASSDITGSSAKITWDTDELSNSVVNYGTTTALGSTESDNAMVKSHSITLTELSENTTYYYEVKSTDASSNTTVDDNNGSYYTFTTTVTDTTPPAAPTGLTATAVSHSRIDLDWNNNTEEDLSHYHVYRSTTSGFNCDNNTFLDETTVSDYPDTSVDDNTTYYYKVTAVDTSNNESNPSNEANATTPEAPSGPTMHVLRIDMELLTIGLSYQGKAIVYIVDENDNPVPSATVYGHWEGIVPSGTQEKATDADGAAPFWSGKVKSPPSGSVFTFFVDNVTKEGWTYDPASNGETSDNIAVP